MKFATKLSFAIFVFCLLFGATTKAEETTSDRALCAGIFCPHDRVIHIKFGLSRATVKSADAETGKVTVEYDNFPGKIYSYDSSNLTKLIPQQEQMRVYQTGYHVSGAMVVAANTESQKVTVKFENIPNLYTYRRDELTYAKGCIDTICVGAHLKVHGNEHLDSTVVGVNPATRDVTVFFEQPGGYFTYQVEDFSAL